MKILEEQICYQKARLQLVNPARKIGRTKLHNSVHSELFLATFPIEIEITRKDLNKLEKCLKRTANAFVFERPQKIFQKSHKSDEISLKLKEHRIM